MGGAIAWLANRVNDDGTVTYSNNMAPYGNTSASFPYNLQITFITNGDTIIVNNDTHTYLYS